MATVPIHNEKELEQSNSSDYGLRAGDPHPSRVVTNKHPVGHDLAKTPFGPLFDDLLRRTVGFDYLPDLFNRSNSSFPHYDIYKQDDDTYVVQIALAGYNPDDIQVSQTDWDLVVTSRAADSEQQSGYLHKGIAKRSFTLRLGLGLHTEVIDAVMKDGMLHVTVKQHDQDSNKPIEVRKE